MSDTATIELLELDLEDGPSPATATTLAEETEYNPDAAFEHSGHRAAVFRPRFSQAHQQFFTPRWICQAAYTIAAHIFYLEEDPSTLNVLDPTCGSGRLLAPFKEAGHNVLGIELDARLTSTARRALGKENVRQGDIMAYGPLLPKGSFAVATINPPFGEWWALEEDSPYSRYELGAGQHHIESQHMVLELTTETVGNSGLLLAVLSGKFLENNPRAAAFLGKYYQIVANVTLPRPFKKEYGIEVDAAFVVALRASEYDEKKPPMLTGPFSGGQEELASAVCEAFDHLRKNPHFRPHQPRSRWNAPVNYLHPGYRYSTLPHVPHLDMALAVDTATIPLRLTARGVSAESEWASGWLKFFSSLPVQAYDAAQGSYAPLGEAYGSLPNILMSGVEESQERLEKLGFAVQLSEHDAAQIERRAERYHLDSRPIRELEPMEYLAYYRDGPITATATATLPDGTVILVGARYELRNRWYRKDEVVKEEEGGEGKKAYLASTHLDRGFLILHFRPLTTEHAGQELQPFSIKEINPPAIQALTEAFDLPKVLTVDDLPQTIAYAQRLNRLMDMQQQAAGGKRLYPKQALDAARMATKGCVALLYEQGGGKTPTIAYWAALRGCRSAVIVTPASVVPGIIENLQEWGLEAQRLNHTLVSRLLAQKRQHRLSRRRLVQAQQQAAALHRHLVSLEQLDGNLPRKAQEEWGLPETAGLADMQKVLWERQQTLRLQLDREKQILAWEEQRRSLEQALARKRRHLRNLRAI